jgi:cytidylate kinase
VEQQKEMGNDKGIVMDGRDISRNRCFPQMLNLKYLWLQAQLSEQKRRYDELIEKGNVVTLKSKFKT